MTRTSITAAAAALIAALTVAACDDAPTAPRATAPRPAPAPPHAAAIVSDMTTFVGVLNGSVTEPDAVNELGQVAGIATHADATPGAFMLEGNAVTPLQVFVGTDSVAVHDINASGQVAGIVRYPYGSPHPVLWTHGAMTALPLCANGLQADAHAVNDAGSVAGQCTYGDGLGVAESAVVWSNGTAQLLAPVPGYAGSFAYALDNAGDAAGVAYNDFRFAQPAYWPAGGGTPRLLALPTGTYTGSAEKMNDAGQIAGWASDDYLLTVAVLWENGAVRTLPALDNASASVGYSQALAVNDLGQAVGVSQSPAGSGHAVLWQEGEVYDLGVPAGFNSSAATGINDHGQVVGYADFNTLREGVRWTVPILSKIDVLPGTAPNVVKLSSKGQLAVAILTSRFFNAANVDASSVTLGNDDGNDTPVVQSRKLTPSATLKDVDRDGDLDLVLQFDQPQMVRNGDLTASTTKLVLLGRLKSGERIRGSDAAQVQ
jgi:probable HAF family extracellular repeat protein